MIDIYVALKPFSINDTYLRRYVDFIQSRPQHVDCLTEAHHILPKASDLFPQYKNSEWNFIDLSLREHFIAHMMLKRAVGGSQIEAYAFMSRLKKYRVSSHAYAEARAAFRNRTISEATRLKTSKSVLALSGPERSKQLSEAQKGRVVTQETRALISKAQKGKKYSVTHRARVSKAILNQPTVKCPHCNKVGAQHAMKRWHFDKCKMI